MTRQDDESLTVLGEAMDWFLRLRDMQRPEEDDGSFALWLERSDLHRQAWEKACKTWELMGEIAPAYGAPAKGLRQSKKPAPGRMRRRWGRAAFVAAACLMLAFTAPALLLQFRADYRTQTAEAKTVVLEDGSTIELSAASAINADITGASRHITLLSGEAFFDVSHDPDRPFIVDAGGVKITVIGTAFDIRLTQEQTTVELARGAVNVSLTAGNSETYVLAPGDVADVDRLTGTLTRSRMDISEIASWRDGRLFLNDVSISAAVAELQRYHPAWIKIPESALAEQRVTGLYDLHDPDRALRALVEPYGGKVRSISPFLRVLTLF